MSDFHSVKTVKGRKPHSCEQCGTTIDAGVTHDQHVGSYYGDFYNYRVHAECHAAAKDYADMLSLYGEEWPSFQHDDNEHDDWQWMVENHPLVAKRLGWDEKLKEWDAE